MDSNSKSLTGIFKRLIFQGLEKVDINNVEQRYRVYKSAKASLEKVQSRNLELSVEAKNQQYDLLENMIAEIEIQLDILQQKQDAAVVNYSFQEQALDSTIEKVDPPVDHPQTLDEDYFETSNLKSKSKINNIFQNKKIIAAIFSVFVLLGLISFFASNLTNNESSAAELKLPFTLEANEALLKLTRTNGPGEVELVNDIDSGILYKVDASKIDKTSRLDFILRGELAKQFNAINEPILVTFHLQKISKANLKLNLLVRGVGKVTSKEIEILDENTNQLFVVTSVEKQGKPKPNALFRLRVVPVAKETEEKDAILINKITFSRI